MKYLTFLITTIATSALAGIHWNGHVLPKEAKALITQRITQVCPELMKLEILNVQTVDIHDYEPDVLSVSLAQNVAMYNAGVSV